MAERNELVFGDGFWKDTHKLPKEAQEKLGELFEMIAENAFDPRLHTKSLGPPLTERYTFRITRDWRVAFRFKDTHKTYCTITFVAKFQNFETKSLHKFCGLPVR